MKRFAILLCASVLLLWLASCKKAEKAALPPIYVTIDASGIPNPDPVEIIDRFKDVEWTADPVLENVKITFDNARNPARIDPPACTKSNGRSTCHLDHGNHGNQKNGTYKYNITWTRDGKPFSNDPQLIIKR